MRSNLLSILLKIVVLTNFRFLLYSAQVVSPTGQPSRQPSRQPTSQPTSQPSNYASIGLIASYIFNGNADDDSGNGNHGTVHSATLSSDRFGNLNSAYSFNGVNSYIEVLNGSPFNFANEFTISMWVKPGTTQATQAQLLSKSHGIGGWFIEQTGIDLNHDQFGYYVAPVGLYVACNLQMVSNVWNHLVYAKKGITTRCYLNNNLVGVGNASATNAVPTGNLPLTIGGYNAGLSRPASNIARFFHGSIDDIAIYNRTLSRTEVSKLFSLVPSLATPSTGTRRTAFSVYIGANNYYPKSIIANPDGSYFLAGYAWNSFNDNSLLARVSAQGQEGWFNEQTSNSYTHIQVFCSVVMDGFLFTGGIAFKNSTGNTYIGKHNLENGLLITAWKLTGFWVQFNALFASGNHTLTGFGSQGANVAIRFHTQLGVVLSVHVINVPGTSSELCTAAMVNDKSFLIGGKTAETPSKGWLSRIRYNGTAWSSVWMRLYSSPAGATINTIAIQNNTAAFAGVFSSHGLIAYLSANTGVINWITSVGDARYNFLYGIAFNKIGSLMAVGYNNAAPQPYISAWYVTMNVKNGTLRRSVVLDGANAEYADCVIGNEDGTFTTLGRTGSYSYANQHLMFVTFNGNGELDPTVLPGSISYTDNTQSINVGAQTDTSTTGTLNFYRTTVVLSKITTALYIPVDLITADWQQVATSRPTSQPSNQPSNQPSRQPTGHPSAQPSCSPSRQPTAQPSVQPLGKPTALPSDQPSNQPSVRPSAQPTKRPSSQPSRQPSGQPSRIPTRQPSAQPSSRPSTQPTNCPTRQPNIVPTGRPTMNPSIQPTSRPSNQPTNQPSVTPSSQPSSRPSSGPTLKPSGRPSRQPSNGPTGRPSKQPTSKPSKQPSSRPTGQPTSQPSVFPSSLPTEIPTSQPTSVPSNEPTEQPSGIPSRQPSARPSSYPSIQPTSFPTNQPSSGPTAQPTSQPSALPQSLPTELPTVQPSSGPSSQPTDQPSNRPTSQPTIFPSSQPSTVPTGTPTTTPSRIPSSCPTVIPTDQPTSMPSSLPTDQPTISPSNQPSARPSLTPSVQPTSHPTEQPISCPTGLPTVLPSASPSALPTKIPTLQPISTPSSAPSTFPSVTPTQQPTSCPMAQPSDRPSCSPSSPPSDQPSIRPSSFPTGQPAGFPTSNPSGQPSKQPFSLPTTQPSENPTSVPSGQPSSHPSLQPHSVPTSQPSRQPTAWPSSFRSSRRSNSVFNLPLIFKETHIYLGSFLPSTPSNTDSAADVLPNINLNDPSIGSSFVIFGFNHTERGTKTTKIKELTIGSREAHGFYTPLDHYSGGGLIPDQRMSRSALPIGDFNGDSYEDLLICDARNNVCRVYFGLKGENVGERYGFQDYLEITNDQNDLFGWSIARLSDVNGDGCNDVAISSVSSNIIYLILGKRSPSTTSHDILIQNGTLPISNGIRIIGSRFDQNTGLALSSAGDFNADGQSDVLFSAIQIKPDQRNSVYILFFHPTVMKQDVLIDNLRINLDYFKITAPVFSFAGFSLSNLGDVNQDGFEDIIIGSIPYSGSYLTQKSYVIYGRNVSSSTLSLLEMNEDDGFIITGGGFMVAGPGDVNGDGINDIMITDYQQWQGKGNSYIMVYPRNMTTPPTFLPSSAPSSSPSHAPTAVPSLKSQFPTNVPTIRETTNQPESDSTFPPNLQKTASPSLAPRTSKPTRVPSRKPPTLSPTVKTSSPTVSPSRKPIINLTPTPTTEIPSVSRTERHVSSSFPTSFPSATPTESLSTPFQDVTIDREGVYVVPSGGKTNYVITGEGNIDITSNRVGKKVFTILPFSKIFYNLISSNNSRGESFSTLFGFLGI
jgi:hypothetical protein